MPTYRTTCLLCGGQLQVIKGRFITTKMPLLEHGFVLKDAANLKTEGERVRCDVCGDEEPLAKCRSDCPDCEGLGWIHAEGDRGREIQRCDSCNALADDSEAAEAHGGSCGCGWGQPWYQVLYELTISLTVAGPSLHVGIVKEALGESLGEDLPGRVTDAPGGGVLQLCAASVESTMVEDHHPSRDKLVSLRAIPGEAS